MISEIRDSNGFSDHPLSFPAFNWQRVSRIRTWIFQKKLVFIIVDTRFKYYLNYYILYISMIQILDIFFNLDTGKEVRASRPGVKNVSLAGCMDPKEN